jgi:hypothetical protein
VAKRKEKEDWVMKYGNEKGKGRLGEHCITQSSFFFLVATLHHSVFLLLSFCHTSSPSLPFPFSLPHFITYGKGKGKGRLGEEVWQRDMKKKTG